MATDIMIKFEGGSIPIEGESTVAGFLKQLEATSWQESYSNPYDPTGSGQVASRTNASDIVITSAASQHSNLLKRSMYENNVFGKITISFLKQIGNETKAYDVREYNNAYITSYSCSKPNESIAYESWSFQCMVSDAKFFVQNPDTHAIEEATSVSLDLAASKTA
jgi:type VI protein secretion system component Hcp